MTLFPVRSFLLPISLAAFTVVTVARPSAAQSDSAAAPRGRIVGRVVDAKSGQGISDVQIQVVGTTTGAATGVDGRFVITRARAGTVTLHARRLGFVPKTVTGIMLDAGTTLEQNISLDQAM